MYVYTTGKYNSGLNVLPFFWNISSLFFVSLFYFGVGDDWLDTATEASATGAALLVWGDA